MELWKIHHQKPHKIEVIHDQFLGLEPGMMSDQDLSLHVSGVATWLVQLYCLSILHSRNKLDSPLCVSF